MNSLRLLARDEEDLKIVSAHLQDASLRVADIGYEAKAHRFAVLLDRFCWECGEDCSRMRAGLHFESVLKVQTQGIDRTKPEQVLSLLALDFVPGEEGAGIVDLLFMGGARIRLNVECIDAAMRDISGPWPCDAPQSHDLERTAP